MQMSKDIVQKQYFRLQVNVRKNVTPTRYVVIYISSYLKFYNAPKFRSSFEWDALTDVYTHVYF